MTSEHERENIDLNPLNFFDRRKVSILHGPSTLLIARFVSVDLAVRQISHMASIGFHGASRKCEDFFLFSETETAISPVPVSLKRINERVWFLFFNKAKSPLCSLFTRPSTKKNVVLGG